MKNINTPIYWNDKWSQKHTGGKYGQNQYHFLKDFIPKDEKFSMLDLGCGRGSGIEYLAGIFPKATFYGLDFADYAIKAAREKLKKYQDRVLFSSDDVYTFDVGSFDYIIMIELLEHLRWPKNILEKYIPIAKKAIYISIPSSNWPCEEHIYAYGDHENPFSEFKAELLGNIDGRKKLRIDI